MSGPSSYRKRPNGKGKLNSSGLVTTTDLPIYHVRRTLAQLSLGGELGSPKVVIPARVILNDVKNTGVQLFATRGLPGGQAVALTITDPRKFYVKARVVACQEIPMNAGIVQENSYQYRIDLRFELTSDAEKASVEEYCKYLAEQVLVDAA